MSESDAVSIVIVTHNSLPALTACLQSLPAAAGVFTWQLVVVDNASTDGSPDAVARIIPSATVIRNTRNLGFAAACNQGAAKATGEWLLFLNPDAIPDPGSIQTLIAAMTSVPKVGLATMRFRYPDGSFQANCRNFPTVANLLSSRGSAAARILNRQSDEERAYTLPDFPETTEVPAVSATGMAVRSDLFGKLGRFDQRYFMYMEDTDLSQRMRDAGYINLFVPQAGAVHTWGKGSSQGRVTRAWHHHLSVWRYFRKFHPNAFSWLLLPAILSVNFILVSLLPTRRK